MPSYDQYVQGGRVLGHYAVAQRSGEIAATLGALGHLARVRWTDTLVRFVLKKLRVGITVSAAVTTATEFAFRAIIARQFTVDFTTAMTQINLAATANTNKMRYEMGNSLMTTAGPGICTTAVLSGQTLTADAAPFAMCTLPLLSATNSTGTAVALPVGAGSTMTELYNQDAAGTHPVVLTANEGILIQPVLAGPASGTFALYAEWEWAEVLYY